MKISMTISILLTNMLLMLFYKLMELMNPKKEKKTAFECGFDVISSKKMTFSTNFLMLMMVFLIFDVEVSILIPFITMNKNNKNTLMIMCVMFMTMLAMMMMKEWKQGALEWTK